MDKHIQIRIPQELYEQFYRRFPRRGERSALIAEFIRYACKAYDKKDLFIQAVVDEMRDDYL